MNERVSEKGKESKGEGWGWERKQHSMRKRPTDTKGRRMTGTRVRPAWRNEEEGDGRDGWSVEEWRRRESPPVTQSLASDISSPWLCGKTEPEESSPTYANSPQ